MFYLYDLIAMKNDVVFGTGGFRGIIGKEFTEKSIRLTGEALARIMLHDGEKREIVIGYDRRKESPEAAKILASVFLFRGIKVYLMSSETPSPTVMYYVQKLKLAYGLMITASHNPADFNGIKVFIKGGYDANETVTERIESEINNISELSFHPFMKNDSNLVLLDGVDDFVDNILHFIDVSRINKNLRVAYDNIYGVGVISIKPLFEKLGLPLVTLNEEHDTNFGGKLPNPIEENLSKLKETVVSQHFDFGFSCDSDADRLGIIDEKGNYVSANEILAIIYYFLVRYVGENGDIVKNTVTSKIIDYVARKLNRNCYEVDVGFKFITACMKEHDALIGGESSGGLTIRNYVKGKDSTFSVAMFLAAVSQINKPVSEIVKEVKEFANYSKSFMEMPVSYSKENASYIVEYLDNHEPKFDLPVVKKIKLGRNYKWEFAGDQWVAIRLSNTEPIIRATAELNDVINTKKELDAISRFIAPLGKKHEAR